MKEKIIAKFVEKYLKEKLGFEVEISMDNFKVSFEDDTTVINIGGLEIKAATKDIWEAIKK